MVTPGTTYDVERRRRGIHRSFRFDRLCFVWLDSKCAPTLFGLYPARAELDIERLYERLSIARASTVGLYADRDSIDVQLRLNTSAGASSWIVTISRRGLAAQARFSLTAYSMSEVLIADSSINRPHKQKVVRSIVISGVAHAKREQLEGSWQGRSAGGNASLASFIDNPQYRLRIDAQAEVAIKLEGPKAFALNVKLVRFLKGQRVEECVVSLHRIANGHLTHVQAYATRHRP